MSDPNEAGGGHWGYGHLARPVAWKSYERVADCPCELAESAGQAAGSHSSGPRMNPRGGGE